MVYCSQTVFVIQTILCSLGIIHFHPTAAYTTIHRINAGTATLKLSKWIEFMKRDVVNRNDTVNELPSMYTMAGNIYNKSLREWGDMRSHKLITPIPWNQYEVGDEIILLADETMTVPFSIEKLDMAIETYIGLCEICAGKDGKMVATIRQLVVHPNLRLLYHAHRDSPVNGYGVSFKHKLVETVTHAGLQVNLRPLIGWGDGRHFLHLNEDVLF